MIFILMKQPKKRSLSQDKICVAALDLISEDGLEGLSMRRLAAQLKVEAASLYNHVKNKSELLDLIQESLFKELPSPKEQHDWKKYLWELANSMRDGLLKFPNVVPLFATRPSVSISALEQTEKAFSILRAAGFKYSDVIFAYQSLCVFVLGHLQAEVGHVPGAKEESEPSLTNALDLEKFPHLMKAYAKSGGKNYDGWFNFGITAIISGLENILKKSRRRKL
jgi:AcrR family transcriptional regulator